MICTWKDCDKQATHSQIDTVGNEWANLCLKHHQKLKEAYKENIKELTQLLIGCKFYFLYFFLFF